MRKRCAGERNFYTAARFKFFTVWRVVLGAAAMVVSAVGCFFSIITDWVACASSPTQSPGTTAPELWGIRLWDGFRLRRRIPAGTRWSAYLIQIKFESDVRGVA